MKLVFCHENAMLVHNMKNVLENQGISCLIKNDIVSAGVGEVPPIEVWPELWVTKSHQSAYAEQLVEQALEGDQSKTTWRCQHCNEKNEPAFELCWKCGSDSGIT